MTAQKMLEILHIEDNIGDALLLKELLTRAANLSVTFNIEHVKSLEDAIEASYNKDYDAVLLDLNLPDGDGIGTLKSFKKRYPNIPIIVMTGAGCEEMGMDALREGAQEYMLKRNITGDVLSQIIQSSIYRKKIENELYRKAHYDDMTMLPNRLFFEDVAATMLGRAKRWKRREAILFIDLDKFKQVNDTFGHDAGNMVLKEAGQRMKSALRTSDVLARYAGDEFVIYMDSDGNKPLQDEDCVKIAQKIVDRVSEPYIFNKEEIIIGCSVGIAIFPDAGSSYTKLMKNADEAMYKAKQSDKDSVWLINTKQ